MSNELLLDLELSVAQYVVLHELAEQRHGGLTGAELADLVGASPQSIGAHVCVLEDRGLIRRPLGRDSGRVIRNIVTADGNEVYREASVRLVDVGDALAIRLTHDGYEHGLLDLVDLLTRLERIVDRLIKESR